MLRLRAWRCQTLRISLPFDFTEVSKRFRVVEGLCLARILVVDKNTLLRWAIAIEDSSRLTASYPSSGGGRERRNALAEDWMLR
jgi:hypothetical protein